MTGRACSAWLSGPRHVSPSFVMHFEKKKERAAATSSAAPLAQWPLQSMVHRCAAPLLLESEATPLWFPHWKSLYMFIVLLKTTVLCEVSGSFPFSAQHSDPGCTWKLVAMLQATLVLITLDSHLVTLRLGTRCKKNP